MSRTRRPIGIDRARSNLISLVAASAGKPCPTKSDIAYVTGVPRRRVWIFVAETCGAGLMEMEVKGADTPHGRRSYRLRLFNGQWTGWTARDDMRRARQRRHRVKGGQHAGA